MTFLTLSESINFVVIADNFSIDSSPGSLTEAASKFARSPYRDAGGFYAGNRVLRRVAMPRAPMNLPAFDAAKCRKGLLYATLRAMALFRGTAS